MEGIVYICFTILHIPFVYICNNGMLNMPYLWAKEISHNLILQWQEVKIYMEATEFRYI